MLAGQTEPGGQHSGHSSGQPSGYPSGRPSGQPSGGSSASSWKRSGAGPSPPSCEAPVGAPRGAERTGAWVILNDLARHARADRSVLAPPGGCVPLRALMHVGQGGARPRSAATGRGRLRCRRWRATSRDPQRGARMTFPLDVLASGAEVAAPRLIGATLESRLGGVITRGRIVETEAYLPEGDGASHLRRGRDGSQRGDVHGGWPGLRVPDLRDPPVLQRRDGGAGRG